MAKLTQHRHQKYECNIKNDSAEKSEIWVQWQRSLNVDIRNMSAIAKMTNGDIRNMPAMVKMTQQRRQKYDCNGKHDSKDTWQK